MGGVLHNTGSFTGELCKENVQDGGEGTPMIFAAVFTVRWRVFRSPIPDSDAAGQHTLNCSPVECGEEGGGETWSFKSAQEVEPAVAPSWIVM